MNKRIIYTFFIVSVSLLLVTIYFLTKTKQKQSDSTVITNPISTIAISPTSLPTQSVIQKTISIVPTASLTPQKLPAKTIAPTTVTTSVPSSSVRIDSITPSSGKIGDIIIIKGSGFGKSSFYYPDPTQFKGMVSFYGSSGMNSGGAPPAEEGAGWWSDGQIKVKVPGVAAGLTFQVEITSANGEKSNKVPFSVLN